MRVCLFLSLLLTKLVELTEGLCAYDAHVMQKTTAKKKPWNLSPHPRLKAFVDEFVRLNGRTSATAVIEEALREFFEKRGINTEVSPEELLRAVGAQELEKRASERTDDPTVTKQKGPRPSGGKSTST